MKIDDSFILKNFTVKTSNNEKKYFLHALLTSKERLFSLYAIVDDQKIKLTHISSPSKEVYEVFALLPVFKTCVSIHKQVEEDTILFACDAREITEDTIAISISNVTPTTGITEMKGWAFQENDNELGYKLLNVTDNIECDFSFRKTIYQKLVDYHIVDDEHKFCGFIMTFLREENKEYCLLVSDGKNNKQISLMDFFEERSATKKLSLFTAFKKINIKNIQRGFSYLKDNGIKEFIYKILFGIQDEFDYDAWFRRNRISQKELNEQRQHTFAYVPKISIIVPTFNTPKQLLIEMIESVRNQSYENWELCIADGSDESSETRKLIQNYVSEDTRIKSIYLNQNYGISGNTNKALELVTGEYTALFDHDDVLELNALYEIVNHLQDTKYDIIYTDEDKLNNETQCYEDPNIKSDYNEDLLLSHNYITHFFVVRTDIIQSVGGFNSEYDGAQDYDVILKCVEKTNLIYHIPKVLYHWRMHEGSTALDPESKMYCYIAGEKAIQAHLDRMDIKATVKMREKPYWGLYHVQYEIKDNPLVSIIIPNYDHKDVLKTCIDSLFNVNTYQNIEIIIVENNSKKQETFDYYKELQATYPNIKAVTWKGTEFNFSAINNYGVKQSHGEYVLFLNNDTQIINPDSIKEMLGICMREDVGIVGAKLLYEDNTIQHAGVVLGFAGYARHVLNGLDGLKDPGYMMRLQVNCDYSAVTAACMMTKKSVFETVHGFDENFKVACNDIDYCLKVRKQNMLVVYNAFSLWHHFESKSRGYENDLEKVKRFDKEVEKWQQKWMNYLIHGDIYYNPNFKVEDEPFELK